MLEIKQNHRFDYTCKYGTELEKRGLCRARITENNNKVTAQFHTDKDCDCHKLNINELTSFVEKKVTHTTIDVYKNNPRLRPIQQKHKIMEMLSNDEKYKHGFQDPLTFKRTKKSIMRRLKHEKSKTDTNSPDYVKVFQVGDLATCRQQWGFNLPDNLSANKIICQPNERIKVASDLYNSGHLRVNMMGVTKNSDASQDVHSLFTILNGEKDIRKS